MTDYLRGNLNNLIIQYGQKSNAVATVTAYTEEFELIYDNANILNLAFDLDFAIGKQLDIIGRIVGINRILPFSLPKKYFGFYNDINSYPMGDKFLDVIAYPFKDKFEIKYQSSELNDYDYRFFIKAKIIKNYATSKSIDINKLNINSAIDYLFNNKAYVIDRQDMNLDIYIDYSISLDRVYDLLRIGLLPRPQGVRYNNIIQYSESNTLGFNENDLGFGDLFDLSVIGGKFASIIKTI